ncbi:MAG: hypothetical protein HDS82_07640 [Bacteroidales bacterium]|nr:hypothetical protein [Bacteroidales bacterium]
MKKLAIAVSIALMSAFFVPTVANAADPVKGENSTEQSPVANGKMKAKVGKDGKDFRLSEKSKERKGDCKSKCGHGDKKKGHKGGHKGKKGGKNPFAGIELTAEQQTKLTNLRDKSRATEMKIREDARTQENKIKQDAREQKKKARDEFDKEVKKILTPEQWTKFESNKAEMQKKHKDASARKGDKSKGDKSKKGPKGKRDNKGKIAE